jgi:hypothetical protein
MSKKRILTILSPVILLTGLFVFVIRDNNMPVEYIRVSRQVKIKPDYTEAVIPPNIAPLNFRILEEGKRYFVKIHSEHGDPVTVFSKRPKILIPNRSWKKLLNENRGQQLNLDVYIQNQNNQWELFPTISNKIAPEDIDSFLVYRKMHPTHTYYFDGPLGIYQRNLENFNETGIINNSFDSIYCVNCHTFCKNDPDKMLLGVRSISPGYSNATLMIDDEKLSKIGAKFGYSSWHPSGRLAVYSLNNLPMYFHIMSNRNEVRNTIDLNSALAYYLVDDQVIKTAPQLSDKEQLENWPAWSGDGRYLYFCRAPKLWSDITMERFPPKEHKQVKYDLVRVGYDIEQDKWGELETVLSSKEAGGLSIAMPKTSPDGRWLLLCMCEYGFFPTWHDNSDLYMIDLKEAERTGKFEHRRLEINSDQSESWQSWSSNSRWIVFSSKRDYGVFTKPYLSYVDTSGRVYKPVVLPQKDPDFYDHCLLTYNTPELIIKPVKYTKGQMAGVFRSAEEIEVDVPITGATKKLGYDNIGQRE